MKRNRKVIELDKSQIQNIFDGLDPEYALIERKPMMYLTEELVSTVIQEKSGGRFFMAVETIFTRGAGRPSSWASLQKIQFKEVFKQVEVYYS